MRFHIATKLALVLILVGLVAAGVSGYFVYDISRGLLIRSAKDRLLTSTQVLGRKLFSARQETVRDLQTITEHPLARTILSGNTARLQDSQDSQSSRDSRRQMATLFRLIMETHPAYEQIRLISARDHGLERVRVDRRNDRLLQVSDDDLQEKGHYAYVSETLKLPARASYMSRITSRQEPAVDTNRKAPAIYIAMPVIAEHGESLGVVVITIDVNNVFGTLLEDLPQEFQLYLASGSGDILIHPDSRRTFGFDTGRRALIQDEFPAIRPLLSGDEHQVLFETTDSHAEPLVAAFIRRGIEISSEDDWLYLGLAQPLSRILEESHHLEFTISRSMLILLPACLILAILLARLTTRPIKRLIEATHCFACGEDSGDLPLDRQDEIGDLARSFRLMQDKISEQLVALQNNKTELEQLVRHDPLTGLPNRRLLQERLDHAIALSQRGNTGIALLFVDLNDFKDINDSLGHDAGDTVLVTIARRLLEKVRVTDTVARLGGDEFIVLLVGTPHQEAVSAIASSLMDSIREDIPLKGKTLNVGASIGISRFPEDGQSADTLLARADKAMYGVKTGKRSGYAFASDAGPALADGA